MRSRTLLFALCLALASGVAQAAAAAPSPDPSGSAPRSTSDPKAGLARLNQLIERVKVEQAKMKSLEARFVQYQENSLLAAPETSKGTVSYLAPDRVRWEYASPNPITIVIAGEEMTTWYRDLHRAEKLKVGRYSAQVFKYLGAGGNLKALLEYFTVAFREPGRADLPFRLDLTPRYARIAQRMKSMSLWIDPQRYLPTRVEVTEPDGDLTRWELQDLKLNGAIPADRFALKLPPDVVVRTLAPDGVADKAGTPKSASPRP